MVRFRPQGGGGTSSGSSGGGSDDRDRDGSGSDPFDSGSTGSEVLSSGGDTSRARSAGSSSGSDDATATPSPTADDDGDGMVQDRNDENQADPRAPPQLDSVNTPGPSGGNRLADEFGNQTAGGGGAEPGFEGSNPGGNAFTDAFANGFTSVFSPQDTARQIERADAKSRRIVDTGLDIAFQDSTEVSPFILGEDYGPAQEDTVDLGGPGIAAEYRDGTVDPFEFGSEPAQVNTDVTDSLTRGRGLITDSQEAELRQITGDIGDVAQNVGDGAARGGEAVTGSETAGQLIGGGVQSAVNLPAAVPGAFLLADTGIEAASNAARTVEEEGAVETGQAVAQTAGRTVGGIARQAEQNPARFIGQLAGEAVAGTAIVRGASRGARAVSNVRTRAGADATVDFEDITSERGAEGELPAFDTPADAPADAAADEVRDRAADNPDVIRDEIGSDQVQFRSESERLPEDVEAQEGQYELPGLFASPDASPLRSSFASGGSGLSDLRLPRPSDFTGGGRDRFSAFDSSDVDTIPQRGASSGRISDGEGGTQPDPTTGGYEFLTEDAQPNTAYVRATGDRNQGELETIYPPGSEFTRSNQFAVNLPDGSVGTLDIYRRADADNTRRGDNTDVDGSDTTTSAGGGGGGDDVVTVSDINRRSNRSTPDGSPVVPPLFTTPSGGSGSGGSSGGTTTPAETGSTPPLSPPTSPPSGGSDNGGGSGSPPTSPPGGGSGGPSGGGSSPPPSDPSGGGSSLAFLGLTGSGGSRRSDFELPEFDSSQSQLSAGLAGVSATETTNFVDPLTGDVLED